MSKIVHSQPPSNNDEASFALSGVRVLDFSHALAGPYCTLLLAQYGATVYKVESPDGGDTGRGWAPPFIGKEAAFFLGLNRGKYSISIDLKSKEGIELCLKLIKKMDVLIENFRPGTMERLGLGYEACRELNPRLIYCSISGYGQTGPSRDDPAMDLIIQCASGLLSITGTESGETVRSGHSVSDITAGLFGIIGILAALRRRERVGLGDWVDVSMFDVMISSMSSNFMSYIASKRPPIPLGTAFSTIVPYRVFMAKDRSFAVAVGTEKLWSAFCKAIERQDLEQDPLFVTNAQRIENRFRLEAILSEIFLSDSAAIWVGKLKAAGVPSTLVSSVPEVMDHQQAIFREMFPSVDHPTSETHTVIGSPIKFLSSIDKVKSPAPLLGEHTEGILKELIGLDQAEINCLVEKKIVLLQTARSSETYTDVSNVSMSRE
jgi:CoA:oxalate CoA-transferase